MAIDVSQADPFSRSAVCLTLLYNETVLAIGSGVLGHHKISGHFLITAWHNLSGRRAGTGEVLSKTAGIPNLVQVEGCQPTFRLPLYGGNNDPNDGEPLYETHKKGSYIDVTVLPLPNSQSARYPLDDSFLSPYLNTQLPLRPGQTCHVVGFPEGLIHRYGKGTVLPIWKTGHIASEPEADFDDQPKLLIDATTRRGMSGAMVVVSERDRNRLVGIYSGRYKQPLVGDRVEDAVGFTSELGWVFKSGVVSELIGQHHIKRQQPH